MQGRDLVHSCTYLTDSGKFESICSICRLRRLRLSESQVFYRSLVSSRRSGMDAEMVAWPVQAIPRLIGLATDA